MHEHVTDPFVKAAKREGYRSRAAYKLLEIDKRNNLFKPGMLVADLGASPGGWSQIAKEQMGPAGRVIAIDLLPMEAIPGVEFIQADFSTDSGLNELLALSGGKQFDVVISDMAPNISGISISDQARAMALAELALEFTFDHLKPRGDFLVKLFQGEGFDAFMVQARQHFEKVAVRKPEASRDRSNEVYLLGMGKKA
ncbi:MAG TPA: RlmE family RNA methyltransferase [Burkholderiales bacterium]|jgi:23S rRNA (uridine2552-2'-O)-methyltransferase|nr:RlmE family RNA methyltransferase [Burkholderiales bacterium]